MNSYVRVAASYILGLRELLEEYDQSVPPLRHQIAARIVGLADLIVREAKEQRCTCEDCAVHRHYDRERAVGEALGEILI